MGIFEDLLLNARSAVDHVGRKAENVIDASKLRLAAADLKSELSQKYLLLGRVVCEESVTGKDYSKAKNELVEKIKELKEHLEEINALIEKSRLRIRCTSCGAYNSKGAVFCNKCGEKLVTEMDNAEHLSPDDVIDFTEDNFEDDDLL